MLPRYYVIDGALIVQSSKTRETNKGYSSLALIIFIQISEKDVPMDSQ